MEEEFRGGTFVKVINKEWSIYKEKDKEEYAYFLRKLDWKVSSDIEGNDVFYFNSEKEAEDFAFKYMAIEEFVRRQAEEYQKEQESDPEETSDLQS